MVDGSNDGEELGCNEGDGDGSKDGSQDGSTDGEVLGAALGVPSQFGRISASVLKFKHCPSTWLQHRTISRMGGRTEVSPSRWHPL